MGDGAHGSSAQTWNAPGAFGRSDEPSRTVLGAADRLKGAQGKSQGIVIFSLAHDSHGPNMLGGPTGPRHWLVRLSPEANSSPILADRPQSRAPGGMAA